MRQFTQQPDKEIIFTTEEGAIPDSNGEDEIFVNMLVELESTEKDDEIVELNVKEMKMKDDVIVMFAKVKNEKLEDRVRPKTFPMTKENRDKLKSMNKILTVIIKEENDIGIDELNSLHYTTAVILAGTHEPTEDEPTKERPDPDGIIKMKIEKVRKWIGKLTMAKRNGSLNKVKHILKGQSIHTKLQANKMRLAALTKKLRTKKSTRERYKNNKLHRHNQQAFYSTMRSGGEGVGQVIDPPPEEELKDFWENLYSDKGGHREDAEWLKKEEELMENVEEASWKEITEDEILTTCKRLANWKAPGLD